MKKLSLSPYIFRTAERDKEKNTGMKNLSLSPYIFCPGERDKEKNTGMKIVIYLCTVNYRSETHNNINLWNEKYYLSRYELRDRYVHREG